MDIKKEIEKIIIALVGSALEMWRGDSSTRLLYALLIFVALYCLSTLISSWKNVSQWIRKEFYTVTKRPLIDSVPGFCGRENVIREIYEQYCLAKGVRIILICGLGGSGKTTVSSYFTKVLVNSPRVKMYSTNCSAKSLHSRTILFVDYAYENLSLIKNMISALKESRRKRILVVLLERTYAKQYLGLLEYDCIIDLNENRYTLTQENLAAIISFNVSNIFDKEKGIYISTGIEIEAGKTRELAEQITTQIDPKYRRPLFAYIIAELYRSKPNLDFSETTSINLLLEKYWQNKTRYHMMQGLVRATDDEFIADKHRIESAVENAKQLVELLTLFCAMTRLSIEYDNKNGVVLRSNDDIIDDEHLNSYITKYIKRMLDDNIQKHLVTKMLEIDIQTAHESDQDSKIVFHAIQFDIVSTWLLGKFYRDSPEYTRELGKIIYEISNKGIDKTAFSFILRSIDEDNSDLITWYCTIKDGFVDYDIWDYVDTLKESFEKLDRAAHKKQAQTVEALHSFLIDFIYTIYEHIKDEDANTMLGQIESLRNNSPYLPETNEIILELIEKARTQAEASNEKISVKG